VAVGTVIATGTNWTITSSPLGAGSYTFTAVQTDAAGNGPSSVSGGLRVTIDTSVPPAPSVPDLVAASDTGTSSTDNITSDKTPTFSGKAIAGTRVELFAGATSVGTDVASNGGNWQITSSALTAGTYSFTATSTNAAGTSAASPGLSVTIQAIHYIVTASNSSPVPGAAVTITAQLADEGNVAVHTAGRVVTWSKTGNGGSFSSATSTTDANGVATVTFTVGTTPGTIHRVTATSPDGIVGTSSNLTVTQASATLTISSDSSTVTYRQPVTLNVRFSGSHGANRVVSFQRLTALLPSTWVTIGSMTTNVAGRASLAYRPPYNTQFRAVFAGAADLTAVTSNTIRVNVRHTVLLRPGAGTTTFVRPGTRITYTATVRPIAPTGVQRVTFLIYRRVGGAWTFRTSATVSTVSGVASLSWRWGRGEWYIRARANATIHNLTAYSLLSKLTAR
jgi:hypothetical protein